MSAPTPSRWTVVLVLGIGFTLLNLMELAFLDGGWPQVVGVVFGVALVAFGILRQRGWEGVRR